MKEDAEGSQPLRYIQTEMKMIADLGKEEFSGNESLFLHIMQGHLPPSLGT